MWARRFLGCIALVTMLAVAGAFAVYQFGGRALTRLATPSGRFEPPPRESQPDYRDAASWIARPDMPRNPARWLPGGWPPPDAAAKDAAAFFIHPTTYLKPDRWNAPLDDRPSRDRAELFVKSQASAFGSAAQIWAPRYRQAAYGAFLLTSADATKALDLAYRDLVAAFDLFLERQPPHRPILLAGHSQGALHLTRLLVDRRRALGGRLAAAYVVGWPVSVTADLPAMGLEPCRRPDQAGCVLSWQSFRQPANPSLVASTWVGSKGLAGGTRRLADMLCVNPLSGTSGGAAGAARNRGTLVPDAALTDASLEPGRIGARCDQGFLMIEGPVPALGPYVLPGNNYHVYDYALFWGSIAADSVRRVKSWRQSR